MLVVGKIQVGIGLLLRCISFESSIDLSDEQVGRASVENEMVYVEEQMYCCGGLHHFEAAEWRFLQVEGPHKLILVCSQLFFAHHCDGYLDRHAAFESLYDGVSFCGEVDGESGMVGCHFLHSLCQFRGIRL